MKKPLLIGCGVVALVTALVVVCVVALGVFGLGNLMEGSNATSKAIFGDKPPEGFLCMGLPLDETTSDPLVLMLHPKSKVMLFARKTDWTYDEVAEMQQSGTQGLIALFETMYSVDQGEEAILEGSTTFLTQPSGNPADSKAARQIAYFYKFKDRDGYTPVALTLLPYPNNKTVCLIALGIYKTTRNGKKDFAYEYKHLTGLFEKIINQTELKNGVLSPPIEITETLR